MIDRSVWVGFFLGVLVVAIVAVILPTPKLERPAHEYACFNNKVYAKWRDENFWREQGDKCITEDKE